MGSAVKTSKDGRGREFRFIVYPESWDPEWRDKLESYCIPMWLSPLHQPDPEVIEDLKGEQDLVIVKKPHHHVIMKFQGKKSPEGVKEIALNIFGNGCAFPPANKFQVHSMEGAVRYLIHADHKDKEQFSGPEAIELFFGADSEIFFLRNNDISNILKEIQDWLRVNGISSFPALADYAARVKPEWHAVVAKKCSYFLSAYCKGLHYEERKAQQIADRLVEGKSVKDELTDFEKVQRLIEIELEDVKKLEASNED